MNTLQDTSGDNKPRRIRRVELHVDMTPMVDVAMLLLTFFMLTAVFNKPQAMEINMPASHGPFPVAQNKLITLFVDRHSRIYTQHGDSDDILPLSLNQLGFELSDLKKRKPDIIALIKIDRRARYERMVDLLDELNCLLIDRFSIAPLEEKEELRLQNVIALNNGSF